MNTRLNTEFYLIPSEILQEAKTVSTTIKNLSMHYYREGDNFGIRIHLPDISTKEVNLKDLTFTLDRKTALKLINSLSACLIDMEK